MQNYTPELSHKAWVGQCHGMRTPRHLWLTQQTHWGLSHCSHQSKSSTTVFLCHKYINLHQLLSWSYYGTNGIKTCEVLCKSSLAQTSQVGSLEALLVWHSHQILCYHDQTHTSSIIYILTQPGRSGESDLSKSQLWVYLTWVQHSHPSWVWVHFCWHHF